MDSITLTAPAKINLFLSVIGKKGTDYHLLQSLVGFSAFGDTITITPADEFSFSFDSTSENIPTNDNNLVICAANLLSSALKKPLNLSIHLSKHIPIGAGLGGGSSDAATTIKGLLQFWQVTSMNQKNLDDILLSLGADVPACYYGQSCYFEGIGEIITPITKLPTLHTVLIYPNQHCSTQEVFQHYGSSFSAPIELPTTFSTHSDVIDFLKAKNNDLTHAAITNIPEIKEILNALAQENTCLINRMSGSGSACFGLFATKQQANDSAHKIKNQHPEWWVQPTQIV